MRHRRSALHALAALLLFTWALPAADVTQIPSVLEEDIAKFRALMSSRAPEYRIEGIQGARLLRLQSFEDTLIGLLDDELPSVKLEAVQALRQCGTCQSVPQLIALLDDDDWALAEHAQLALEWMTGRAFGVSQKQQWRTWWGSTGLKEKQANLLKGLASDDPTRRYTAARALRCMATPACEGQLMKILNEGKGIGGRERKLLTETLDRIGTAKSMPYFLKRASVGDRAAAWALGGRGGKEAEEALLKGFRRNRSLDFLLNLDRVKTTKCGPFLPALSRNFRTVIHAGYAEDMRYRPSPLHRVSANLIRRSGKGPMLVDLILAEMELKPKESAIPRNMKAQFQDLRKILKPEFVREGVSQCAFLLGALQYVADDPSLARRLIPLLRSKCLIVRIYAGMTLGRLRAPEAIGPILDVIEEGYPFIDATAMTSAKHTGARVMVDGKRMRQSQTVRWLGYLCAALGQIGNEDARKALETFAVDPKAPRDVRYGSIVGLGTIGSPESLPILRRAAQEDIIGLNRDVAKQTILDIELAAQNG